MRIGIYGNHLALALIACGEACMAADVQPVWRSDVMFREDQTEPFDAVAVLAESFMSPRIDRTYAALEPAIPVFLIPNVHERSHLLDAAGFRAFAEFLGLALPTADDLVAELEAKAKADAIAAAAGDGEVRGPAEPSDPIGDNAEVDGDDDGSVGDVELPKVAELATYLATITDGEQLLELMMLDTRKTAAPIYEARMAELTAPAASPPA